MVKTLRRCTHLTSVGLGAALVVIALHACNPDPSVKPRFGSAATGVLPTSRAIDGAPLPVSVDPMPDGWSSRGGVTGDSIGDDAGAGTHAHPAAVFVPSDWTGIGDNRWITIERLGESSFPSVNFGIAERLGAIGTSGQIGGQPAIWSDADRNAGTPLFLAVSVDPAASKAFDEGEDGLLFRGNGVTLKYLKTFAATLADTESGTDDGTKGWGESAFTDSAVPEGWKMLAQLDAAHVVPPRLSTAEAAPRGTRSLALNNDTEPATQGVLITTYAGDADTAMAMGILLLSDMWSPSPTLAARSADGHTWLTGDGRPDMAIAVFGGHPVAVTGTPVATGDDALTAQLLSSLRVIDVPAWEAGAMSTGPSVMKPASDERVLLSGESDDIRWSIHGKRLPPLSGSQMAGDQLESMHISVVAESDAIPATRYLADGGQISPMWLRVFDLGPLENNVLVVGAPAGVDQVQFPDSIAVPLKQTRGLSFGAVLRPGNATTAGPDSRTAVALNADGKTICESALGLGPTAEDVPGCGQLSPPVSAGG